MSRIDRTFFFGHLQQRLYPLRLDKSQIDGHETILDEWERSDAAKDDRWLAYMLATAQREAGAGFQPICENLNYGAEGLLATFLKYSCVADARAHARQPQRITNRAYASRMGNGNEKSGDGWHYRGRGPVQITGEANYTKFGCAQNPDMALAPESAIRILFDGMINGGFTGKSLPIASAGPPLIGSAPGRLSIRAISAT